MTAGAVVSESVHLLCLLIPFHPLIHFQEDDPLLMSNVCSVWPAVHCLIFPGGFDLRYSQRYRLVH
jgi:hypothetical protein